MTLDRFYRVGRLVQTTVLEIFPVVLYIKSACYFAKFDAIGTIVAGGIDQECFF